MRSLVAAKLHSMGLAPLRLLMSDSTDPFEIPRA